MPQTTEAAKNITLLIDTDNTSTEEVGLLFLYFMSTQEQVAIATHAYIKYNEEEDRPVAFLSVMINVDNDWDKQAINNLVAFRSCHEEKFKHVAFIQPTDTLAEAEDRLYVKACSKMYS